VINDQALDLVVAEPVDLDQLDPARRVLAAFLVRHCGRTRTEYLRALRNWAVWCEARQLPLLTAARPHVELWQRQLEEQGLSAATRAVRLAAVSGYYETAVDEQLLGRNPAARVRRPKLGRDSQRLGLEREQARRLLEVAAEAGPRDHALVCLLLVNGLRVSEALAITPADLDVAQEHRVVSVIRKGGHRERVVLPPRSAIAVDDLVAERAPLQSGARLFVDAVGANLDVWDARRVVRRLARAAGVAHSISPHSLRHTFVTSALAAGVPLHRVQDAAGHADPRTTRRYDRARHQLEGHAAYAVGAYLAG
jgi:site-specific recombinase XerD